MVDFLYAEEFICRYRGSCARCACAPVRVHAHTEAEELCVSARADFRLKFDWRAELRRGQERRHNAETELHFHRRRLPSSPDTLLLHEGKLSALTCVLAELNNAPPQTCMQSPNSHYPSPILQIRSQWNIFYLSASFQFREVARTSP